MTPFGWRFSPTLFRMMIHEGNDYLVGSGTPIYATAAGVVTRASVFGAFGNQIKIDMAAGSQARTTTSRTAGCSSASETK